MNDNIYYVIIPCYNPTDALISLFYTISSHNNIKVIIVDDGSNSDNKFIYSKLPCNEYIFIENSVNCGKGFSIKQGFSYLVKNSLEFKYVFTMDCDGQHKVSCLIKMINAIEEEDKFIYGTRNFGLNTPIRSRFGNISSTIFFLIFYGFFLKDTQSGLRGFHFSLLDSLLKIQSNRYSFESESLIFIYLHKYKIKHVDILAVYFDSNISFFKPFKDSISVMFCFFKYFIFTSLFSLINQLCFLFSNEIYFNTISYFILSVLFFFCIKKYVFYFINYTKSMFYKFIFLNTFNFAIFIYSHHNFSNFEHILISLITVYINYFLCLKLFFSK